MYPQAIFPGLIRWLIFIIIPKLIDNTCIVDLPIPKIIREAGSANPKVVTRYCIEENKISSVNCWSTSTLAEPNPNHSLTLTLTLDLNLTLTLTLTLNLTLTLTLSLT